MQDIKDFVDLSNALKELSEQLSAKEIPIELSSFDNFIQDIFSLSYPQFITAKNPRPFNSWHIRRVCSFIDDVLASDSKMAEVVLPRYHLKSTILGLGLSIYRFLTSFGDSLFISYKSELVDFHMSNIKLAVEANKLLSPIMVDLNPRSSANVAYKIGSKKVRMFGSGIFAMKRGIHTDGIVCADDILGTQENPMVFTDLEKAERMFNQEVLNIPNSGCPLVVYGTTIDYSDILFKLRDNPQFKVLWLPAIHPDPINYPDREVLWEDKFDKKTLDMKKGQQGWKAFSSEFLLTPVLSTEAFFTREELDKVIDPQMVILHRMFQKLDKAGRHIVMGVDIGKKRNPSHVAVFVDDEEGNLVMLYQAFWDNLDYTEQVSRINTICDNFQVDKCYWDATRGEMEERGLARQCIPIKFTGRGERNQASYAADFSHRVETKTIKLVDDDRYISQILCVTNDLKASSGPMGHGDSFWSTALAIGAYEDFYAKNRRKGISGLGNLQDWFKDPKVPSSTGGAWNKPTTLIPFPKDENICKICGKRGLEKLDNGKIHCPFCFCEY